MSLNDCLDSPSAIEAMKKLQEIIKKYENENDCLRKELSSLRSIHYSNSTNQSFVEEEKRMKVDEERKKMNGIVESLNEIRKIKIENEQLVDQISNASNALEKIIASNIEIKNVLKIKKANHDNLKSLLNQYDRVLLQHFGGKNKEKMERDVFCFNNTPKNGNTSLFSSKMQNILKQIQEMPQYNSNELISTKISRYKVLWRANDTIEELNASIEGLEKKGDLNKYDMAKLDKKKKCRNLLSNAVYIITN